MGKKKKTKRTPKANAQKSKKNPTKQKPVKNRRDKDITNIEDVDDIITIDEEEQYEEPNGHIPNDGYADYPEYNKTIIDRFVEAISSAGGGGVYSRPDIITLKNSSIDHILNVLYETIDYSGEEIVANNLSYNSTSIYDIVEIFKRSSDREAIQVATRELIEIITGKTVSINEAKYIGKLQDNEGLNNVEV